MWASGQMLKMQSHDHRGNGSGAALTSNVDVSSIF